MAGLDPAISRPAERDARVKPARDDEESFRDRAPL
jgi:hypothetical protein